MTRLADTAYVVQGNVVLVPVPAEDTTLVIKIDDGTTSKKVYFKFDQPGLRHFHSFPSGTCNEVDVASINRDWERNLEASIIQRADGVSLDYFNGLAAAAPPALKLVGSASNNGTSEDRDKRLACLRANLIKRYLTEKSLLSTIEGVLRLENESFPSPVNDDETGTGEGYRYVEISNIPTPPSSVTLTIRVSTAPATIPEPPTTEEVPRPEEFNTKIPARLEMLGGRLKIDRNRFLLGELYSVVDFASFVEKLAAEGNNAKKNFRGPIIQYRLPMSLVVT